MLYSTPGKVEMQQHSISSGLFSTGEGRAGQKSLREERLDAGGKFRQCNSEPSEVTSETCPLNSASYTQKWGANHYVRTRINYLE